VLLRYHLVWRESGPEPAEEQWRPA